MVRKFHCIINVGPSKFYLHQTAQMLDSYGFRVVTISGMIPDSKSPISIFLRNFGPKARLNERISDEYDEIERYESILTEFFWQIGSKMNQSKFFESFSKYFFWISLTLCDIKACHVLFRFRNESPKIYYVRSGFGNISMIIARKIGYKLVIDHSVAHPLFLNEVLKKNKSNILEMFSIEKKMLLDINKSSYVITNSRFVVETFRQYQDYRKIEVFLPPINKSLSVELRKNTKNNPRNLVYFGTANLRKGIDKFFEIVSLLPTTIPVVTDGNWDAEALDIKLKLHKRPNTCVNKSATFGELVQFLDEAKYFLFPTQAEGAARTVTEAMHSGVIVLTTKQAGVPFDSDCMIDISTCSADQVAQKILELEANSALTKKMQLRAREYVSELERDYSFNLIKFLEDLK